MAFIPALVGGVASIIGGISASKKAKKQQEQQQQIINQQNQLIDQQKQGAQLAYGKAQEFLPEGKGLLDLSSNFWKNIATGDRSKLNEFLAPEVNAYNREFDNASAKLLRSGPRGASADNYASLQFQRPSDISNLMFGARKQSIAGLQDLGSIYTNAGLSALGTAGGQTASAANSLAGMASLSFGREQAFRQQASDSFGGAANSIASLLSIFKGAKEQGKNPFSFFG